MLSLLLLPGSNALDTQGGAEDGACRFAPRIGGIPSWAFRILVVSAMLSLLTLIVIQRIPDDIGEAAAAAAAGGGAGKSAGEALSQRGRVAIQRKAARSRQEGAAAVAPLKPTVTVTLLSSN